ncbi:LLM class flavin-dependent oxidoreductase [Amycolatopsis sp. NPDC001319]|uniref:LLM class flavin-dependent oxidoreductase n=1 Tax=unclassified Amycolatopsis TaxID=2618356 RepID=UPI0036A33FE4
MRDDLLFGVALTPTADLAAGRAFATAADDGGLDLLGIQDAPFAPDRPDTFVLAGDLLAHTDKISVFPDVASLPLRPPALLAKTAAALDIVSGGRFELALGAGGYWDAITQLGVPRRSARESNVALEEAVTILRALWADGGPPVRVQGEFYSVSGAHPGPAPVHPVEIWVGAQGPKSLALTGRIADGWAAPIASYLPYEKWAEANRLIDDAAVAAGRKRQAVRRIAQIVGTVTETPGRPRLAQGADPVRGTAAEWAELLAKLGGELPYTGFVFMPEDNSAAQVAAFAREVVPEARRLLAR